MPHVETDVPTPQLLLRANPGIDSPESMLSNLCAKTGTYFAADDFPVDGIYTALARSKALALVMQSQLGAEGALSEDVLRDVAWAQEGLLSTAMTMLKAWSRHALVN